MATLNPNLRDFWQARKTDKGDTIRYRTLYGGRISSKSHDVAGMAIARANHHTERVLCLRMFQNRIADSVYTLLKDKIDYFGLSANFNIFADAIEHKTNGSIFRFYGMARNIDEIKSFEGATIAWIEEAHNLTSEMFATIRPTVMRNENAEMWVTFNPKTAQDFVYQRFVLDPPEGAITRQINYPDNPFLNATALADIESAQREDPEEFQHVYMGVPRDTSEGVLIKRQWVEAAIDAHLHIKPASGIWGGATVIGYDVADDGDDKNAIIAMKGSICVFADEWKGDEDKLRESAARVKHVAESHYATHIGYDSIGVGAGTGSHLTSMGWRDHFKFNAGAKVCEPKKKYGMTKIPNEDFFSNLKAQSWWQIADRFRNTYAALNRGEKFNADSMISISSKIDSKLLDKLKNELSTPKRDFDNAGKVKVESKKDMAKRSIASPNIADAFIIANSRGMLARKNISEML